MAPERKNGAQKKRVDKSGLGKAIINRRKKQAAIAADPTLHTSEIVHGLSSVTQENDLDEFLSTAQLAETDFTAERQNIKVVSDPTLSAQTHNPYLLTPQQEREMREKHNDNRARLQVPRRPAWTRKTTVLELERTERDSFLEWRRGLADLQDNKSLLLTPFERNLEVWRQLWRTLERSDLIVQIVDARNPLNFRSEDLEKYVRELSGDELPLDKGKDSGDEDDDDEDEDEDDSEGGSERGEPRAPATPASAEADVGGHRATKKKNLLLINKSDLLTRAQREYWATYFEDNKIQYAFFSAANGMALQEERARREAAAQADNLGTASPGTDDEDVNDEAELEEEEEELGRMKIPKSGNKLVERAQPASIADEEDWSDDGESDDTDADLSRRMRRGVEISAADEPDRTRILSVLELEELFLSQAPQVPDGTVRHSAEKLVVGLVGYPNVGKSSTINALIGEKKVSVSATPGKTKHFQTIRLSPDVLLCDCPGLVFPQFAATKADLVCDGVLPIDQMREHTGPVALVTKRIPQEVLEGIYGLRIVTLPVTEGGSGVPTAAEFLTTYAIARGFFTGGMGNADTARASRFILKDYVNGKLLYCHPPPNVSADVFNAENRDLERLASLGLLRAKRAPTTRVPLSADTYVPQAGEQGASAVLSTTRQSSRAQALDKTFFSGNLVGRPMVRGVAGEKNGSEFSRVRMFAHQGMIGDDGTARTAKAKARAVKQEVKEAAGDNDKKHFKPRRQKQRSGRGYDDF